MINITASKRVNRKPKKLHAQALSYVCAITLKPVTVFWVEDRDGWMGNDAKSKFLLS